MPTRQVFDAAVALRPVPGGQAGLTQVGPNREGCFRYRDSIEVGKYTDDKGNRSWKRGLRLDGGGCPYSQEV